MKILFFSATGNSLWVAKTLSDELLSIPKLARNKKYEIESDVIGIVCPIYTFGIPQLVAQYLSKVKIKADYVFAVLTYGKMAGDAAYALQQILAQNGNRLDYAANLLMVDSNLSFFAMEKELAILPKKDVDGHFAQIQEDIAARKHGIPRGNAIIRMMSAMNRSKMESAGSQNTSSDANGVYSVTKACNNCGICEKVCPVGVITVEERPVWGPGCIGCQSCVHSCPQGAIHVKGERSKARYRHPDVTVAELIKANSTK